MLDKFFNRIFLNQRFLLLTRFFADLENNWGWVSLNKVSVCICIQIINLEVSTIVGTLDDTDVYDGFMSNKNHHFKSWLNGEHKFEWGYHMENDDKWKINSSPDRCITMCPHDITKIIGSMMILAVMAAHWWSAILLFNTKKSYTIWNYTKWFILEK
jgi:hypothetical protein